MPNAANLVVNNAAAVSKTFTLMVPAAGDDSVASWALKEGASPSVYPTLTVSTRKTSNGGRKVTLKLVVPDAYTDTTTGLGKVNSKAEYNLDISVPDAYPDVKRADHAAYFSNLVSTALLKSCFVDAVPLT